MKKHIVVFALIWAFCVISSTLQGQETNTLELIQKLQRRIEELEQKVKLLEQQPSVKTNEGNARQRVEDLDKKVEILERDRENDKKLAADKAKSTPTVSLGLNGLSVRSGDSNFVMYVHGY